MTEVAIRRPVFFNLTQIQLPVGAVTSITHRITGVLLAVGIPLGIYILDLSLQSPHSYVRVIELFGYRPSRWLRSCSSGRWHTSYPPPPKGSTVMPLAGQKNNLNLLEEDGGPLIFPRITEQEQDSFDATCRKFYRFLTTAPDDNKPLQESRLKTG
jgi:hypothetical protein